MAKRLVTQAGVVVLFVSAVGLPAQGQDEGSKRSAQPVLEEILVTAQHREERLQDVPISVQVLDEVKLIEKNLVSLADVALNVPAVHVYNLGRSAEIFIRGIGSSQNPAFDQSVGMFVDDIYHGRSRASNATFLDLEHVEILRGPQSTFFGNNAIAGAFNIVTRKPGNEFDFSARAAYQPQARRYVTELAFGGPLSDTLLARAAANVNGQQGWIRNVTTGKDIPNDDNKAGRVTVVFTPTADLDATVKIEGARNKNTGARPEQTYNCPPPAPFPLAGNCLAMINQGLPIGLDQLKNGHSDGQGSQLDTTETVATINYRRAGHTLTSVTGYYSYDYALRLDLDQMPAKLQGASVPEDFHQFSQEIRLASPVGGTLEYMAGLYYQNNKLEWAQDINFALFNGRVNTTPSLAALIPYLPVGFRNDYVQDETTTSAFGALTWRATDRLKLGAGLRASRVRKSYDWSLYVGTATRDYGGVVPLPADLVAVGNTLGLGTAGAFGGSRTDNAVMPSAKIQYQLTPEAMAYLSYSRGFKAGTFNGSDNTANPANLPLEPEYVDAYEAGLKAELFDRRLSLNGAIFRADYSDLQVSSLIKLPSGANLLIANNAAKSRSQGLELEAQWAASPTFRLATNVTYLDAKWLSYPGGTATYEMQLGGVRGQDLSGRRLYYAPQWSGSVSATHESSVAGDYQLTAELNVVFSSDFFLSAMDDPLAVQDSYAKLGCRLTLETPDRRWAFDLIGANLNDKTIKMYAGPVAGSLGSSFSAIEQPRNLTVQARYRF